MRDVAVIGIHDDLQRVKKFVSDYVASNDPRNFETFMMVAVMKRLLFMVPGGGWLYRREHRRLVAELEAKRVAAVRG